MSALTALLKSCGWEISDATVIAFKIANDSAWVYVKSTDFLATGFKTSTFAGMRDVLAEYPKLVWHILTPRPAPRLRNKNPFTPSHKVYIYRGDVITWDGQGILLIRNGCVSDWGRLAGTADRVTSEEALRIINQLVAYHALSGSWNTFSNDEGNL